MSKRIPLYAVILAVVFAVLITFQVTYLSLWRSTRTAAPAESDTQESGSGEFDAIEKKLELINSVYKDYFVGEIDSEQLETGIMTGYVYGTGDRYGQYMDAQTYAAFSEESAGDSEGIGIVVVENDETGLIEVVEVLPDSPAEKADIRIGDLISAVDGQDAAGLGYYTALDMMQGKADTTANFTVYRSGEFIDFSLVRAHVDQNNVTYHMYEDGFTGIVRIVSFDALTAGQFKAAVSELTANGATRFIFDVRGNTGGQLTSVAEMLDYLVPEGNVIRITDRDGKEETIASDASEIDAPMAVLVNGGTASAAELFTATLRDFGKSVTVGTTTFGKGTMQTIVPFSDGTALRISYRMYSPPVSDNYEGVGIEPDVTVELDEALWGMSIYKISDAQDNQLQAALAALNQQ